MMEAPSEAEQMIGVVGRGRGKQMTGAVGGGSNEGSSGRWEQMMWSSRRGVQW